MEKSLNEGRFSGKEQDKLDVVILHFPSEKPFVWYDFYNICRLINKYHTISWVIFHEGNIFVLSLPRNWFKGASQGRVSVYQHENVQSNWLFEWC